MFNLIIGFNCDWCEKTEPPKEVKSRNWLTKYI